MDIHPGCIDIYTDLEHIYLSLKLVTMTIIQLHKGLNLKSNLVKGFTYQAIEDSVHIVVLDPNELQKDSEMKFKQQICFMYNQTA